MRARKLDAFRDIVALSSLEKVEEAFVRATEHTMKVDKSESCDVRAYDQSIENRRKNSLSFNGNARNRRCCLTLLDVPSDQIITSLEVKRTDEPRVLRGRQTQCLEHETHTLVPFSICLPLALAPFDMGPSTRMVLGRTCPCNQTTEF